MRNHTIAQTELSSPRRFTISTEEAYGRVIVGTGGENDRERQETKQIRYRGNANWKSNSEKQRHREQLRRPGKGDFRGENNSYIRVRKAFVGSQESLIIQF